MITVRLDILDAAEVEDCYDINPQNNLEIIKNLKTLYSIIEETYIAKKNQLKGP